MPLLETKGAASAQGFGEFAKSGPANYIEDVFQTWLYTGNSTTGGSQTITNNVDLSTKGGLVWIKGRSQATTHILTDTARGAGVSSTNNNALATNLTDAEDLGASYDYLSAFSTTGFTVTQGGTTTATRGTNYTNFTYVSWAFVEQSKFFDVVTYTGNGANRTIAHNLGSVPGCIIVKRRDASGSEWVVYHRSLANTQYLTLNDTVAARTGATYWNSTTPTATEFSLGTNIDVNANGGTYVAYLFAHDAGGFGLTGTDNVISCGSFTTDGSGNATVTLGYEPQWILVRPYDTTASWNMIDTMRGWFADTAYQNLFANSSNAESTAGDAFYRVTSTGFTVNSYPSGANLNFIYIAIRRGPMKVPTSGTSVFSPNVVASDLNGATTGFPVDMLFELTTGADSKYAFSRLTGINFFRTSATTSGSGADANWYRSNTGIGVNGMSVTGAAAVYESFRRAPGYFDVVVYTGTGANRTVTHNLGVAPELMLIRRTTTSDWWVYDAATGNTKYQVLNLQDAPATSATAWNNTTPTSSVFTVGTGLPVNQSGVSCMAYLFATCPGVSKVGSYTGTGNTLQVDCGFAGGARFILIKRTDSTGDWYVYDSARGIVSGNDPYLRLNSTAAEVTNTDWVDTHNPGFELSNAAGNNVNINTATYLFLAIA